MSANSQHVVAVRAALMALCMVAVSCAYLQPRETVPYTGRQRLPLRYTEKEMAVYREPYATKESRLPTLQWPREIPLDGEPADVVEITTESSTWAGKSETPKLLLHFEPGAIMRNLVGWCEENFKNLKTVKGGAGVHFVQEDQPTTIGKEIAAWMRETGQA